MSQLKKKFYIKIGTTFWALAILALIAPSWPYIYYRLSPQTSDALASTIASTIPKDTQINLPSPSNQDIPQTQPTPTPQLQPKLDLSLPKKNGLIIDSIGIRGEIHEGEDWKNILKKGIWRVPNFATSKDTNKVPIILAAHRWGYISWSTQFRRLNSFYNLPKLKVGDEISIIWNQREYKYKIYSAKSGEKITDYSADLILYTCQLWNSPIRVFRYARRIN